MSDETNSKSRPIGHYYFSRLKVFGLSIGSIAIALAILYFAHDLLDPNWQPAGRRSKNDIFNQFLLSLPPWGRAAIFASFALALIIIALQLLFHAFDRKPDFIIGPDGISRNMLFRFRKISWAELQTVRLDKKKIVFVGRKAPGIAKKLLKIEFDSKFFSGGRDEVLNLIRHYRPDLTIE